MEVWKTIEGFEDYKVSNIGTVISTKRQKARPLKKCLNTYGYEHVLLTSKNTKKIMLVHRLVANAFIENMYKKPFVNHINGVRNDNSVFNLEWVTISENNIDAYKRGSNTKSKITKNVKHEILEMYSSGNETYASIGRILGLDYNVISRIVNNKTYNYL